MADVMITLTLDLEQLKQGLDKVKVDLKDVEKVRKIDIDTRETESKIKRIRDSFAMWGLAIQGAISSAKLVGSAISGMIQPALDAERAITRVETAVKSTGGAAGYTADELKRLAEGYQEAFAFDADDIMNQVTTPLLTFTNITGEAFRGAQEAVMNMTRALGDDGGGLQGVAMQVGKALQDPITGITALRRAGVSFSEDQQAVIKSLVETGDLASAQKMILEELGKEFGGQAASYANSYAGSLEAMKIQYGDMIEAIGQGLLPILSTLADALSVLLGWFNNLTPVTKGLVITIPLLTVALRAFAVSQAAAGVSTVTLTGALTAAATAVKAFLASIPVVGWALLGLGAAVGVISELTSETEVATDATNDLAAAQESAADAASRIIANGEGEVMMLNQLVTRLGQLEGAEGKAAGAQNERKMIIDQLRSKYGPYLGDLDLERAAYDDIAAAANSAASAIMAKAISAGYSDELMESGKKVAALRRQWKEMTGEAYSIGSVIKNINQDLTNWGFGNAEEMSGMGYDAGQRYMEQQRKNNPLAKINDDIAVETKRMETLYTDLQDYLKSMPPIQFNTPPRGGAGGAASRAVGDVDTALSDFERLKQELDNYFSDEGWKVLQQYADQKAIIEANTAAGSQERMSLLVQLEHWKEEELLKIDKQRINQQVVDETAYYEELKWLDGNYYEWKKQRIEDEIEKLDLSEEQRKKLLAQRLADLDKEKAAWDAMPLDEVLAKYAAWKAQMADTKAIGVAGWETIRDGLIAIRDELQKFADMPGVAGILAGIESEIDVATLNAGKKKGNWFFHGLLGFDPDNEDDQAKVSAVKNTYSYLSSQIQDITNGLLQMNESRRKKELDRIQEVAEREKWSKERLLAAQAETNARYDKEERKLKNVQKNFSYVQAVINIAEGVTKALALGPILGPIMAGVISAMGIVQLGIIKAQKFASGGLFRGKGGPRDDANIVAISDGEYIVNAAATRRYKPVLDLLNSGSSAALDSDGGASYSFVAGGMVRGGGVSGLLERLIEKIEILNLNLVKKDMSVTVENRSEIESIVKHSDRARVRLERRGYVPSLS